MTDDKYVDRYVRITNRERFLIVRALSLLENACDTLGVAYDGYGRTTPCMKEVVALGCVFTRENWLTGHNILTDKVLSARAIRSLLDSNDMEQDNE